MLSCASSEPELTASSMIKSVPHAERAKEPNRLQLAASAYGHARQFDSFRDAMAERPPHADVHIGARPSQEHFFLMTSGMKVTKKFSAERPVAFSTRSTPTYKKKRERDKIHR